MWLYRFIGDERSRLRCLLAELCPTSGDSSTAARFIAELPDTVSYLHDHGIQCWDSLLDYSGSKNPNVLRLNCTALHHAALLLFLLVLPAVHR